MTHLLKQCSYCHYVNYCISLDMQEFLFQEFIEIKKNNITSTKLQAKSRIYMNTRGLSISSLFLTFVQGLLVPYFMLTEIAEGPAPVQQEQDVLAV